MNVDVKWLDVDLDENFQRILIDSLKDIKHKEYVESINATVFKRPNSRHVIDVKIKTNNPDEYLYTQGISFNLEYSLKDLQQNLKYVFKHYDPKAYERRQKLEIEWEQERARNRKLKEEKIAKEIEHQAKAKQQRQKAAEIARIKQLEEKNLEIVKKLEKKRKLEQEAEKALDAELEARKKEIEEELKQEQERLAKAQESIQNVNVEIEKDIQQDEKVRTEIKESKDKLKELWSEENECLVIVDSIKEWGKKVFSSKHYKMNEPFELIPGRSIYHDGYDNFFIANENGEWEPFYEIDQEFEVFKQNRISELEQQLAIARAKRKRHITELEDQKEVIEKLKESKQILKEKQLEQKREIKELKKNQKLVSELTENDMKMKASEAISNIDVAEVHPANEPFEVSHSSIFAYHDGEGNYYVQHPATQEWIATTKEYIYADNSILNLKLTEDHPANETFENSEGIFFYHDGMGHYFKSVDSNWVASTYEECYPKAAKLIKKRNKKDKSNDNSNKSYAEVVSQANKKIEEKKIENIYGVQGLPASESNTDTSSVSDQPDQTAAATNSGQQWVDEATGVSWYLDENGNYFYADENGNWVPYQ